jgi:general secretion pathway protein L
VKIVGLKIERGRVAASVIEKNFRQAELKDSFSMPFATDTELADILREKSRDWAGARVISSIPGHQFSQRTVTLPFGDRKRVEKALPFELEDNVPFPLDDVEIDHVVQDRPDAEADKKDKKKEATVLGIMLPKTVLRQHLDFLASAGMDPQVIVPSYVGLLSVAKMVPVDGAALLIDGSDCCLKSGNTILACRSFSPVQTTVGIRHVIKALETEYAAPIEKACLLSENEAVKLVLADLGIAIERVTPDYHGKTAADPVSLGLALGEQVNFRKGDFAYRRADEGKRKQRRALIIAGIIAAVFAAINLGVKFYLVEAGYGKLDREIKEIYRQTFPEAKSVADPVRQFRAKLVDAQKKFGVLASGSSALDVMKAVTEGIPKEVRVSFQEFILEGDRLKLSGDAASFESIDKMKAELQKAPPFAEVAVQDTRMGVDNKVKFRFEIKLKQAM